MNTIQQTRRVLPMITVTALLVALGSLPAAASQDPRTGFPAHQATSTYFSRSSAWTPSSSGATT